eukprot:TRINITY_DN1093_c0_g1_i1.p1 TRINITY_DN1093_c0_g1~~TRINITY_DN1093_c0_g1_i1.p1  ORF type:complete len:123 (-),score=16.85 TRINITY_DN1093_c0_g1_i1:293-661(-)
MCRLGRMFFEDGMTLNNKICPAEKYRATRTREAPLCGAVNHVTNALCMACGHIFFNDKIIDYAGDLHNVKLPREVPKLSIGDHVVVEEAKKSWRTFNLLSCRNYRQSNATWLSLLHPLFPGK